MPRIDPLQLLKCLSVLLNPAGGILSRHEVPRLVNLMTKFSKKLVSKCVYVLILKVTDSELVDMFMAEGGWTLVQTWLQDAMHMSNWDLVKEILSLLLICPVDVERLKLNNIPKLVKNLSRRDDLPGIQSLSAELVQHWLIIVKSNPASAKIEPDSMQIMEPITVELTSSTTNHVHKEEIELQNVEVQHTTVDSDALNNSTTYVNEVQEPENDRTVEETVVERDNTAVTEIVSEETEEDAKVIEKMEEKTPEKKSSSSSSRSRDKKKSGGSGSSSGSSSSSKSGSSSRDKSRDKDRDKKDKDKHRSNGSSKHRSSSSSKDRRSSKDKDKDKEKDKDKDKSKQAEKDKDTLAKIKPQSIDKIGKIPKKSSGDEKSKENKEIKKKPTMSIEVRKNREERPKTVKIFNSKMRSTGLEEEVKPPPPRPTKKPIVQLPTIPSKRPSPPKESAQMPPEKKLKIDTLLDKIERPGAIKLIPPKPKPTILQESDIFMDALTAATTKKEPKKRKRRPSVSKDTPNSPSTNSTAADQGNATSPVTSPLGIKNLAPINFYQDTLNESNAESEKENNDITENESEKANDGSGTPTQTDDDGPSDAKRGRINDDGLRGVLCYSKKKGPKQSIKWKTDDDLVEIRYFELDETERVNVTKTFMDMAKMDMCGEREAVLLSRKLPNEDTMGQQTIWRFPYLVDQSDQLVQPGSKSLEKDIQFAREKNVLQALYFDKRRIPDSPFEPDPENHQMKDPVIIPLDDPDGQENDLRNTPWPEPKGSPPHIEHVPVPPQVFPNIPGGFNPTFPQMPPPGFQGMPPRFPNPGPGHNNFMPPNMMPNGNMMGPPNMGPPPEMMNQGPMNPNMFGPGPDGFIPNDNPNFPMPFNNPNMNNMFPPNNFNMGRGGGGNRGGFRGRGGNNGPWVRMNGPGNWNRGGGGGHRGGRLCKNVKNHGYCRNRDNCPFIHPN